LSLLVVFFGGGVINFHCCHYCYLPSEFLIQISIIHDKLLTIEGRGFTNGCSSIIHNDICSLIHRMYYPKSCHSDIKYCMTLNIICSVVCLKCKVKEHALKNLVSHSKSSVLTNFDTYQISVCFEN
jgi:hypothetical protein